MAIIARTSARTGESPGYCISWNMTRGTPGFAAMKPTCARNASSILASGDQTKSDTYTLRFNADLKGITGILGRVMLCAVFFAAVFGTPPTMFVG